MERIGLELKPLSIDLIAVNSAREALLTLQKETPPDVLVVHSDAALMDTEDDLGLCQCLRANANLATIYVVVLAEHSGAKIARGADDTLRLPYAAPDLRARVKTGLRSQAHRRVLARRERRRALEWLGSVVAHELNNPLAVAMSSADCVLQILAEADQGGLSEEDLKDLRELASGSKTVLQRMHAASQRLTDKGSRLETSYPRQASWRELLDAVKQELPDNLVSRCQFSPQLPCFDDATFDCRMMVDASTRILLDAGAACGGAIRVWAHLDGCRAAVLMEFDRPPDSDPESILEPRLCSRDNGPPRYEPGLSSIEATFARFGGQIFARPTGSLWRFGLTLPTLGAGQNLMLEAG